jgi:hypothetical protein
VEAIQRLLKTNTRKAKEEEEKKRRRGTRRRRGGTRRNFVTSYVNNAACSD